MILKDTVLINDNWKFILEDCSDNIFAKTEYDDSSWEVHTLPHDWDTFFAPDKDNLSGAGGGYAKAGTGWYRKVVSFLEEELKGYRYELIFEGIYMESTVFVNGKKAGGKNYGYSTFSVDITDKLEAGENIISVRVNNSKQPNSRWYTGSGIYRDVYLRKTKDLCIDLFGVKSDTNTIADDLSFATVDLKTKIENYSDKDKDIVIRWTIKDKEEKEIATTGASLWVKANDSAEAASMMYVKNPDLWSTKNPYLYSLETKVFEGEILVDSRVERIGIRSAEFTRDKGFLLNGERVKIKGVCLHHDSGLFGAAFHKEVWRERLETLKEMGVNGIRCSHNPPAPAFLDLCDEMGFIVMDEIFDEWTLGKNKNENYYSDKPSYGFSQFFSSDAENEIRTMLRRDYNHPSIVLWSIGNEIPEQGYASGAKIAKALSKIVHDEDPKRLNTSACDNIASLPGLATKEEFLDALDVVGYNYVGRWRERAERFYEDDKIAHPDRLFIGTENPAVSGDRGDYSLDKENNFNYVTASLTHEALWRFTKSRDYVAGDFIWTGIDYLGEAFWPRRGANFGAIDTAGFKKDAFYYYKSIWNENDVTLHLLPHWNFEGEEGTFKQVLCYTNCERVKLYLNGEFISEKSSAPCPRFGATKSWDDETRRHQPTTGDLHLSWDVPFKEGELRAEGYIGDKLVKECVVKTTGKTAKLEASVKNVGAFSFVELSAIDKDGALVPNANPVIFTEYDDTLEFIGMDAGNMLDLTGYKEEKRAMLAGKLLAVFKKKENATKSTVLFKTDGLSDLKVDII